MTKAHDVPVYPWYARVEGDALEQGDIIESCPVLIIPPGLDERSVGPQKLMWETRDLIVISHSCDLANHKLIDVLLRAVWFRDELPKKHHLRTARGIEDARRGYLPAVHVLAASDVPDLERELRVVDFRRTCSLPIDYVLRRACAVPRLRLLPPYREHLSQAFARFFMRVGLPLDIPALTR